MEYLNEYLGRVDFQLWSKHVEKGTTNVRGAGGPPANAAYNQVSNAAVCNTLSEMEPCVTQVSAWIKSPPTPRVFLFALGELHREATPLLTRDDKTNTAARGATDGFNAQH